MSAEEKIENCEFNLKQIKHFEPDPYYTMHFFKKYFQNVIKFYNEVFQEANRDFGLFVDNCTLKKLEARANEKNDLNALKFLKWIKNEFKKELENPYPKFAREIINLMLKNKKLPKIKIMLRAKERYNNDSFQEMNVKLKDGKIRSNEELSIEMKRQMPIFLEIINNKRSIANEPKINENQVVVSTFMDTSTLSDIEIVYALEVYIPIMRQFVKESRNQIKNLTQWNNGN